MLIKNFKRTITSWKTSTFEIYKLAFEKYGGSVNMHPDVVSFFMKNHAWKIDFFHYEKNGDIKGAYFLCNGTQVGIMARRRYPLSSDEILIPFDSHTKCFFPDKTNKLSMINKPNIINATWSIARKKQNCIIKEEFSTKFEKTRRNEVQRFIRNGGEIKCIEELSDSEIVRLYISLFQSRFGNMLPCYKYDDLLRFVSYLRKMIFGHVLFWNNKPCAIDIVLKSESSCNVYYDVPNGAILNDDSCMKLSPGSVLMWSNINRARKYCHENNKKMIYSIGAFRPEWKYKLLWSAPFKLGKCLC
ncbi:TPA: antimicrobial resistance protein Mig-14 [Escherichia coli]|uniref:antimicrobial resistance protein Mig-14 n=1 Tax=Escherichia coli TaxID=562 RepID=UPI000BE9F335|nr:antimicrobial resistance protein Mig-14 [Escherichia coli]MBS9182291.1 antimicrobial resistance protein Mig-14 [Escherichia coli]MWD34212.1 antimicrobial resistance protein Mig-14 [Escherichia coli]HAH3065967.1 antimicrobial resistance protein Mig-14 [Escherichia coli]HAH3075200.1 antimicrobial resistance protein Mig-14 [Escherichia coli]HBP4734917.1 antimicrobial resistance protein Mig-14 [Escherichia coli]